MTTNQRRNIEADVWLEKSRAEGTIDFSYAEDRATYRWTTEWISFSKKFRALKKNRCEVCNSKNKLSTHHRDKDHYDVLDQDKFSCLCFRCHQRVETLSATPDEAPDVYKPHLATGKEVRKFRSPPAAKAKASKYRLILVPEKGLIVPMNKLRSKLKITDPEDVVGVAPIPTDKKLKKTTSRGLHLIEVKEGRDPIADLEAVLDYEKTRLLEKAKKAKPMVVKRRSVKKVLG
jgi:hypothetical protein